MKSKRERGRQPGKVNMASGQMSRLVQNIIKRKKKERQEERKKKKKESKGMNSESRETPYFRD